MKYFELFDIAIDLFPDETEIKNKFYRLSRQFHPDIHTTNDTESYLKTMEMSGLVNKAYKTLTNLVERLKYILDEHKQLEDKNEVLPPDFLMEMMELNEEMMEARMDEDKKTALLQQLDSREKNTTEQLQLIWNQRNTEMLDSTTLTKLKSSYYQLKYLLRIRKNLNSFAAL